MADIVSEVRAVEKSVAEATRAAQEERRKAIDQATQQAAADIAAARARLQHEGTRAVEQAREEAARHETDAARKAAAEAEELRHVSQDRLDRAVERVIEAIRERWQSTE